MYAHAPQSSVFIYGIAYFRNIIYSIQRSYSEGLRFAE